MLLNSLKAVARRVAPESLYRLYRKQRVRRFIEGFEPHTVTHTYGGHVLRVRLEDGLAASWYDKDWPTPGEFDRLPLDGATVFDLGAHQGVVALILARRAQHVVAVEAVAHNARVAEINRSLNGQRNLTIVHAAITAGGGTVHLAEELNARLSTHGRVGKVGVRAVTVDGLAAEHGHPDVLYIDVEGAEIEALRGAARTLARKPTLFIEVHVGDLIDGTTQTLVQMLDGYRIECFDEDFASLPGPSDNRFWLLATPDDAKTTTGTPA
jgi:FkbM family methyltransferase